MKQYMVLSAVLLVAGCATVPVQDTAVPSRPGHGPAPNYYVLGTWSVLSNLDKAAFYPPRALRERIDGEVHIDCIVNMDGTISTCTVLSETPEGYGFGEATVKMVVQHAHVDPQSVEGGIRPGDRKGFILKWERR